VRALARIRTIAMNTVREAIVKEGSR